jgi:hypothetical protein
MQRQGLVRIQRGRVQRLMLALAAAMTMTVVGTGGAFAQISQVEPYWAYVTEGDVLLRSGFRDSVEYYPVAKLAQGTLVRVDGESKDWMQVTYPPGTTAFAPFDTGLVDVAGKTFTLTKQSRLSAANMNDGLKGSWRPLLATPLEPGTKLTLAEFAPVESNRGKAWKVIAPEQARGFLPTKSVRKANESEIALYQRASGHVPNPQATTSPGVGASTTASPEPTNPSTNTNTGQLDAPAVVDLRNPNTGTPTPAETNPPPVASQPWPTKNQTRPAPSKASQPRSKPTIAGLEAAFNAVLKLPIVDGEFNELIAEFERAINELPSDEVRTKTALGQRLELLRIRADLQAQRRQIMADQEAVSGDKTIVEQRIADFDRARQYVVVGRLSASTIYDGTRLPLMYRVQTVGGTVSGRTLGYVRPQEGVDPERYIGAIVGIVGEANLDPALRLNIVTPTRIDSLDSLTNQTAEATPTESPSGTETSAPAEPPSQADAPTDWKSPSDPR